MAYEAQGRQIASQLESEYGKLCEARCDSKSPWQITLTFERGTWVVPRDFIFKFGYGGSGPDCFHAFLQASGFATPKSEVEKATEGTVFTR
jgi:hypothetical protein